MNKLTNKELAVIELISNGIDQVDAVQRVYDCKDRQSARNIKNTLFKRPRVVEEYNKIQELRREKLADKGKKIVDYISDLMSDKEIAVLLVNNAKSDDRRMSDTALEKILKLKSSYPPTSFGIFRDLEKERAKVLTEAEATKLLKQAPILAATEKDNKE